jgi:hypothetical protein
MELNMEIKKMPKVGCAALFVNYIPTGTPFPLEVADLSKGTCLGILCSAKILLSFPTTPDNM